MKTIGIVRNLDELGRITLPKELRRTFGISTGTPIEISTLGKAIVLTKYEEKAVCCNCGKENVRMIHAEHGNICVDCLDTFNAWR